MRLEWEKLDLSEVYVVVEHQGVGRVACDSIDGHLVTYGSIEDAENEAKDTIEDLNEGVLDDGRTLKEWGYAEDSWGGVPILAAEIGDNQEHILMPDESCGAWKSDPRSAVINRSVMSAPAECKCMTIDQFRVRVRNPAIYSQI